jgi:prevent-host-death family protein
MRIVNIHEAKTHLSKLVDLASKGEPFIIAKAGKPLVKVAPIKATTKSKAQRLGFMVGQGLIPEDFDRMGEVEIERLFAGDE